MILVPLFDLKFLTELAAGRYRNFKSAALAAYPAVSRPRIQEDMNLTPRSKQIK